MTFWETDDWHEYERLCGDEPGTRANLLAVAGWETLVVDLSLSEAELWRAVRKSYKSLAHRHEDAVRHVHQGVAVEVMMSVAQALHRVRAGRDTRHADTWRLMGEWARDGKAELWVIAKPGEYEDQAVEQFTGYVYFVRFGNWSYYASGVTVESGTSPALIWAAMQYLKTHGVRWFELGWLTRPGDTDKDRAISFFKTGWGGIAMPAREAPLLCRGS